MEETTHLQQMIDAIDSQKVRYDKQVKKILADIQILARIVKYTVPDVAHLSVEEIIACIDQSSVKVEQVYVMPGLTNSALGRVESVQTEDAVPNEGYVTYDIRCSLYYEAKEQKIIINIEAQKSISPEKLKYHIENRMQFYLARAISAQKETEFWNSNYDDIKKVYSIWICMDTGEKEDSISTFRLEHTPVYGKLPDLPELDKINGVLIRIRDRENVEESKHELIAMLEDLLSLEDKETKKRKLKEKYNLILSRETEKEVGEMCNLSDVVEERGIRIGEERGLKLGEERGLKLGEERGLKLGEERGLKHGIIAMVNALKEACQSDEFIVKSLMKGYSLTEDAARQYLK